jgi:hypothetical protein
MTDQRVHELLVALHHELKHADAISDRDLRLFEHLALHVRQFIEQPDAPPESLVEKLEEGIAEVEASHPTLAVTMRQVVSVLDNMGV